jgi:short-subunit dehydrogenase
VPHLLPYNAAKFATVGLSEGLYAELAHRGVKVTTIVPGLMRTGSFVNALFKGRQEGEYTWFSLGASLPFISMDAERAARQIVEATKLGEPERTLSLPANLIAWFHGLFPGTTMRILSLVNRYILPAPGGEGTRVSRGKEIQDSSDNSLRDTLTGLGQSAAERFNQ